MIDRANGTGIARREYDLLRRLGQLPRKGDKSLKKPATREDLLNALKLAADEIEMLIKDNDDLSQLPSEWEGEYDAAKEVIPAL